MTQYECKSCGYKTIRSFNFTKHLQTKKHKRNQDNQELLEVSQKYHKSITEVSQKYHKSITKVSGLECRYCQRIFSHKNNLYRHQKHYCKEKPVQNITNNTNITVNNNNNKTIMMMSPKEVMNTFFPDSPSFKDLIEYIRETGIDDEDIDKISSAREINADDTCYMVIAGELDRIYRKKYKELTEKQGSKIHDNYMITNDKNNRSYLAKGKSQWAHMSTKGKPVDLLVDSSIDKTIPKYIKSILKYSEETGRMKIPRTIDYVARNSIKLNLYGSADWNDNKEKIIDNCEDKLLLSENGTK